MPIHRSNSFIGRRDREFGCKQLLGDNARVQSGLSGYIKAHHTWDPRKTISDSDHGGIFNFDFSKNGSLLGAACERKSVLLFDPFNGKLVASKTNAHTDCVNCVKFLDDRLFATCSDDTTVALWDTRYLKHNVQTFRGHSNWVKNIEYDSAQGILLTSGFDGCIYTWNINRYSNEESSNKVFYTSGLMRSKLSPDFSKLIISTHEGYMIVVHNLDLSTLREDLNGFKPNMYRLMQRSQTPLRIGLMYNHVFEQERNRVQFIADWPVGNDANIISSLQVHPQGWCVLSRNTDSTEHTEWTCVHELLDDNPEKKPTSRPWEMERVTPHTSSAYCSSTNTPAFSSLAPSNQRRSQQSSNENAAENATNQSNARNASDSTNQSSSAARGSQSDGNRSEVDREMPGNQMSRETDGRTSTPSPDNTSSDSTFTPPPVEISGGLSTSNAGPPAESSHGNTSHNTRGLRESVQYPVNDTNPTESGQDTLRSNSFQVGQSLSDPGQSVADVSRAANLSPPSERSAILSNQSQAVDPAAIDRHQQVPLQVAGPMHNSLIQIRRGARQEDGSFSFSISVHTPSGRTIEFSQDDLNSDDEDSGIRIERIVSHPPTIDDFNTLNLNSLSSRNVSNRSSSNLQQNESNEGLRSNAFQGPDFSQSRIMQASSSQTREATLSGSSRSTSEHPGESSGPVSDPGSIHFIDNSIFNDDDDYSEEENESEHDLIEEDRYEFSGSSDDNDNVNSGLEIEYSNQRNGSSISLTIENRPGTSGSEESENLFRNTGFSRIRRAGRLQDFSSGVSSDSTSTADNRGQSSATTGSSNNLSFSSQRISQTASGTVDSQPRNNSFMFVLQSNQGQRRRILNLSYLDSYSEVENNQLQKNIHQNRNKLLGYVEECNVGRGFIKEVGFSSDGRLISSPFGFGLRIFAFDSMCNELCDCVPSSPVKLYEVTCSLAHVNCVVATKFSPVHNLIVSGCLDGKVAFHQPVL